MRSARRRSPRSPRPRGRCVVLLCRSALLACVGRVQAAPSTGAMAIRWRASCARCRVCSHAQQLHVEHMQHAAAGGPAPRTRRAGRAWSAPTQGPTRNQLPWRSPADKTPLHLWWSHAQKPRHPYASLHPFDSSCSIIHHALHNPSHTTTSICSSYSCSTPPAPGSAPGSGQRCSPAGAAGAAGAAPPSVPPSVLSGRSAMPSRVSCLSCLLQPASTSRRTPHAALGLSRAAAPPRLPCAARTPAPRLS
jgi:hypothetical protein